MRGIRSILLFLVATIVLCVAALTILIATLNDDHYRWITTRAAKYFAGLEMTVEGPFSVKLSSEPFITASKVRISDVSGPGTATAEIGRVEVKVALLPLISGTVLIRHLLIHDASAEVRASVLKLEEEKLSNIFLPVFESVSLSNVQLTISDDDKNEAVRLLLGKLSLDDVGDEGPLYMKGEGTLNAEEFKIDGRFGSVVDILKSDEPYPLDFRLDVAGLSLILSGTIDDPVHCHGLNMRVVAETGEMTNLLRIFNADFPNLDQLSLDAKIVGDASSPGLADMQLNVSNASNFNLAVKGSMENMLTGKGTSLQVSGSCTSKNILKMLLPEEMPEIHRFKGEGRIRDGNGVYFIEALKLNGSNEQGATMKAEGTMNFSRAIGKVSFRELDIQVQLSFPTTTSAKSPAVDFLPELGAMSAKGHITGTSEALSIENLSITVGESGPVRSKWQGRIGRVPLSSGELPSEVDIVGSIDADEASVLASFAAISLPNLGPLKTTLRIIEQEGVYRFKDIQLSMGSQKNFWLKGAGSVDMAVKDGSVSLGGLDAEVAASAPNLATIPILAGLNLPDLQPLQLNAHIVDRDGHLSILDVEEFKLNAGTKEDFLKIQGQASGLPGGTQRVVEAFFKTTSKPWIMKILKGSEPENHVVEGKMKLVDTPGEIRIKELEIRTTGPNPLYLKAGGTARETGEAYEFEGRISSGVNDTSSLQSFLGIELPHFGAPMLEGKIKGNMTKGSFEGTVRFGSSQFSTTISHSRTKQRPIIAVKIVAPAVYLADIGFYPGRAEDLPSESKSKPKPDRRLFSDTPFSFHALKAIDLSASVDIDKLKGENFVLNKLDFDMSLGDGKLRVAPAKVIYKSGFASIDFTIDAVSSKPQMALKVTAEDVDIGALLNHIHAPPSLKGQLNLVVDLQSAGNSFREIATSLGGEIGLAIEKGKIKKAIEFMGADAVDFLTAISPIRSKAEYTDLHCMALRFIVEEGIGKSEIIYLETPEMYVKGVAYIDLHTETMKMVLQPKPKKGLPGMTSAVTINGPIADPQVRKLPFREAAKLYGEIFMPVVFLPLRGLGYLWYLIKKDKDEESPCLIMGPRTE